MTHKLQYCHIIYYFNGICRYTNLKNSTYQKDAENKKLADKIKTLNKYVYAIIEMYSWLKYKELCKHAYTCMSFVI